MVVNALFTDTAVVEDIEHLFVALPEHGGDLLTASQRYRIAVDDWIDLSTGINPNPYPIINVPTTVYQRLPYQTLALQQAMAMYYGSSQGIAVPGTQAVIEVLPDVLNSMRVLPVLVPAIGYSEHATHWRRAGNGVQRYPCSASEAEATRAAIDAALQHDRQQHLVLIQPNNPTTACVHPVDICRCAELMSDDACVIVASYHSNGLSYLFTSTLYGYVLRYSLVHVASLKCMAYRSLTKKTTVWKAHRPCHWVKQPHRSLSDQPSGLHEICHQWW